jgi:hypothetical protein
MPQRAATLARLASAELPCLVIQSRKGAFIDIGAGALIWASRSGLAARPNQSTPDPPRQSGELWRRQSMLIALGGEAFDE